MAKAPQSMKVRVIIEFDMPKLKDDAQLRDDLYRATLQQAMCSHYQDALSWMCEPNNQSPNAPDIVAEHTRWSKLLDKATFHCEVIS